MNMVARELLFSLNLEWPANHFHAARNYAILRTMQFYFDDNKGDEKSDVYRESFVMSSEEKTI